MFKKILIIILLITSYELLVTNCNAQDETLTITTYYPSPYGVYREMRAQRMAIGDNYISGSSYCWAPDSCTTTIDANADLVVQGNVGIGTTGPGARLTVQASDQRGAGSTALDGISIIRPDGAGTPSGIFFGQDTAGSSNYWENMIFQTLGGGSNFVFKSDVGSDGSPNEVMRITRDGNVGIGTTSPQAKLHINGTAGRDGIMFPDGTLQTTAGGVPAGSIMPYAGSSAPNGWLLCAGQTLTEGGVGERYEALYNVIGTTYGGSGASNFKVPDLRGRFALGKDNMGGTSAGRVTATQADNLGQGSGAETHTLTVSELPSHRHLSGPYMERTAWGNPTVAYGGIDVGSLVRTGSGWGDGRIPYTDYIGNNTPHNNMPPYLTLNYIIKY